MKRLLYIFVVSSIAFIVVSCNMNPRMIPESELKPLIYDLLLTEAILSSGAHNQSVADSVDFYQPVFDKYGYTQRDFQYTIYQLSGRKSKPLANIFDEIFYDMMIAKDKVSKWFAQKEHYDSLAESYFSDTIFKKDTLIIGSTKNVKYVVENPIKGDYTFIFTYHGQKEYAIPLRQNVATLTYKDKKRKEICQKSWVSRSFAPNLITMKMKVPDSVSFDSLIFRIEDPNLKDTKFNITVDSSKSYKFRVYYSPNRSDARKSFFRKVTGLGAPFPYVVNDSMLYDRIYTQICAKDSCSLGPYAR